VCDAAGAGRRGRRPAGWLPLVHAALSVSITLAEKIRLAVVRRLSMNVHFSLLALKCSVVSKKAVLCFSDRLPRNLCTACVLSAAHYPGADFKESLEKAAALCRIV
jgi:hypothetical protein